MNDLLKAYQAEHAALVQWFSMKPTDDDAKVQGAAYELRIAMQYVTKLMKSDEEL